MKIALLARSLDFGGAERQLVALGSGLKRRGHDVRVIVFYGGGMLAADLAAADVPVHSIDKRGRWDVVGFVVRLVALFRREQPEVVYSFLTVPNIVATLLCALVGGRLAWGIRATRLDLARYDRVVGWTLRLQQVLAGRADVIICNSQRGRDDVAAAGFPIDRLVVVANGIDTERFRPNPAARTQLRAVLGIPDAAPLIGMVARLDPMKGHDVFVRAAAQVSMRRPDAVFLIVGDGTDERRRALRKLVADLAIGAAVRIEAARNDVPEVLAALDLLCAPSRFGEGFSNVVGEAMACGVACVVTDVGDARAIVADLGWVVRPGSEVELSDAIVAALDDRSAISTRVRQRIVAEFSLDRMVQTTETLLWETSTDADTGGSDNS